MSSSSISSLRDALQASAGGDTAKAIDILQTCFVHAGVSSIAWEALSLLRDGRPVDAAARIERYLDPKFPSVAACAEAYAKVMEAQP